MGNYLTMADKQRILALLELAWSYRRIQRETGVHRDTVDRHDPRRVSKPADVSPNSTSGCEPYRDYIAKAIDQGLTAQRIWQDLREEYSFGYGYASVKHFVRRLKKKRPEVAGVMAHPPGKGAQVDFFQRPPTLQPTEGRWCRPWILRVTLSCSRHGYEEAMWNQDRPFPPSLEHAFLDFGGVPEVLVLGCQNTGSA